MVKLLAENRESVKASVKSVKVSPFKLRRIARLIRNKEVTYSINMLRNLPQRGAEVLLKLINSAVANARNNHKLNGELVLSNLQIDQSMILKRSQPRSKGRAFPIHTLFSSIVVELKEKQ